MADTGYEEIEKLTSQKSEMLDNALKQQQDIVNQQTQMNVDELEKNKEEVDKDATKTNKALYSEYKKASNPYGANAENLASQGLGNSGYAETTQTNLYNNFQTNVTNTLNNARDLKADFDFQISQARKTGDITLAQNALELYTQKMQLLSEEYELKNNREQFLYQKQQDALAQSNWEKEYAYQQARDTVSDSQWQKSYDYQKEQDDRNYNYQKSRDKVADKQWNKTYNYNKSRDKVSDSQWNKTFDYQKSRDKVSDSQWQKEYELSKKAYASRSSSKSSSSKSSSNSSSSKTTSGLKINDDDTAKENNSISSIPKKKDGSEYTPKEIISSVKMLQGPGLSKGIKDGISGKTFSSIDELLNYYGYASTEN